MSSLPRILNLLESFRGKAQVQTFLQLKEVPYSGTWETVRAKIEQGLKAGKITENELIELLEDIEEHGNQYVYLYDFDPQKAVRIRNRASFLRLLTEKEKERTLDKVAIVEKPTTDPILVSAYYDNEHVKLKWVQKRAFRRPIGETVDGDIATVRYQIIPTRAVDLAIVDLAQQKAVLCIQKIEPGIRDYKKQLGELFGRLGRFVDSEAFNPLDLGRLMKQIGKKNFQEARRRRYRALDANGALIDVTSSTESEDIFNGGLYEAGCDNYKGAIAGIHVNAYWKPVPSHLDREIHTIFPYKQVVNTVVFTQRCLKKERDYVLSRIESVARS